MPEAEIGSLSPHACGCIPEVVRRVRANSLSTSEEKAFSLAMIGLGASSRDRIAQGIHLRWMFHPQLGFPPDGFLLYRRKNDPRYHASFDFSGLRSSRVNFPVILRSRALEVSLKLTSDSAAVISLNGRARIFNARNRLRVQFSPPISMVQIKGILKPTEQLSISALFEGVLVESRNVKGSARGEYNLDLHANHFDELVFEGPQIRLYALTCWVCKDETANAWEEPLNLSCGVGLPFAPFTQKNAKLIEKLKLRPEQRDELAQHMIDCRLRSGSEISFTRADFSQMRTIVYGLEQDGITNPVGWSLLDEPSRANEVREEDPNVEISPYDLLLVQAENPDIAKILGLYWVDQEAEPGTYYDYKIVAEWPETMLRKLEHEVTLDGDFIPSYFSSAYTTLAKDGILIAGPNPRQIDNTGDTFDFARTTKVVQFKSSEDQEVVIMLPKPAAEVQIFLAHAGHRVTAIGLATQSSTRPIAMEELSREKGIIQLRGEYIQYILLKGLDIALARVHYNEHRLPYGTHQYVLCALKRESSTLLEAPRGLVGHSLKSMLEVEEEQVIGKRLRAGLRWNIPKNTEEKLPLSAPIAYHVYRKIASNRWEKLTKENPIHVVPPDPEISCTLVETSSEPPECVERPYFVDVVEQRGTYTYAVTAVDLFGRESSRSEPISVELKHILPPPPMDLTAQFLDKVGYNPSDVSNPQNMILSEADRVVLARESTSGIIVRWKWTRALRELATDIHEFIILFQPGWLNLFKSVVTSVQRVSPSLLTIDTTPFNRLGQVEEFEVSALADRTIPANSLHGEWMRQGHRLFLIWSNTAGEAGQTFKIRVKGSPKALGLESIPRLVEEQQMPLALEIKPSEYKPEEGREFVIPLTKGAAVDYTKPENWPLAHRVHKRIIDQLNEYEFFIPSDAFFPNRHTLPANKVEYAQVAICSASSLGEAGRVSSPVAVMAIYRTPPSQAIFTDTGPLEATPANIYGKSSFTLTWPTDATLQYDVYRAFEDTLFVVDRQLRTAGQRDRAFYEQIPHITPAMVDNLMSEAPDYSLTAIPHFIRKELASRTDGAFTKITAVPWAPTPEGYKDATLDGQGDNRYYYRVQAVDEIGNRSPLGSSTLLVQVPQVTPPQSPSITKIVGGDRQIILYWSANPETFIREYHIYRADSVEAAQDIRLMNHVHLETVSEPLAKRHWIDFQVLNGRPYWYRLESVDIHGNRSQSLRPVIAQACRRTPPFPPDWVKAEWSEGQVVLEWNPSEEGLMTLVQHYNPERDEWMNLTDWLMPDLTSFIDTSANNTVSNYYRLKCSDRTGNTNTLFMTREISPP